MNTDLTIDKMLDWMIEFMPLSAMADFVEAVELAGDRATQMVNMHPLGVPSTDELMFDKVFYYLRDNLGIATSSYVHPDDGVEEWEAYRSENDGIRIGRGETEAQAIVSYLRHEVQKQQSDAIIASLAPKQAKESE